MNFSTHTLKLINAHIFKPETIFWTLFSALHFITFFGNLKRDLFDYLSISGFFILQRLSTIISRYKLSIACLNTVFTQKKIECLSSSKTVIKGVQKSSGFSSVYTFFKMILCDCIRNY